MTARSGIPVIIPCWQGLLRTATNAPAGHFLMNSFVIQLKQRRVYRVAIGYAVAATVLPAFHAPELIGPGK
jgi:hypothetical protein